MLCEHNLLVNWFVLCMWHCCASTICRQSGFCHMTLLLCEHHLIVNWFVLCDVDVIWTQFVGKPVYVTWHYCYVSCICWQTGLWHVTLLLCLHYLLVSRFIAHNIIVMWAPFISKSVYAMWHYCYVSTICLQAGLCSVTLLLCELHLLAHQFVQCDIIVMWTAFVGKPLLNSFSLMSMLYLSLHVCWIIGGWCWRTWIMNDVVVNWFVCSNLIVWCVSSGGRPFFLGLDTRFILIWHLVANQFFLV